MEIKSLVCNVFYLRWLWYIQWAYQMELQVWAGNGKLAVVSPDMICKAKGLDELSQQQ